MPGIIKNPGITNTIKDSHKKLSLDEGRKLTDGEIALCKKLFGNAIDYRFVRIHKGKLIPGVQSDQVSMTPWGELYMPENNYKDDFSIFNLNFKPDVIDTHHFIHEMTHVWQYHRLPKYSRGLLIVCGSTYATATGISQVIESISDGLPDKISEMAKDVAAAFDPYTYRNEAPKDFYSYNMESQAEILADYFVQEIMGINGYIGKPSNKRIRKNFFYDKTLTRFFDEIDKSESRPRKLNEAWGI